MFLCALTFDRVYVLSDGAGFGPHWTQLVRNSVNVAFDAVRNWKERYCTNLQSGAERAIESFIQSTLYKIGVYKYLID